MGDSSTHEKTQHLIWHHKQIYNHHGPPWAQKTALPGQGDRQSCPQLFCSLVWLPWGLWVHRGLGQLLAEAVQLSMGSLLLQVASARLGWGGRHRDGVSAVWQKEGDLACDSCRLACPCSDNSARGGFQVSRVLWELRTKKKSTHLYTCSHISWSETSKAGLLLRQSEGVFCSSSPPQTP
jgi:hypothetical protein